MDAIFVYQDTPGIYSRQLRVLLARPPTLSEIEYFSFVFDEIRNKYKDNWGEAFNDYMKLYKSMIDAIEIVNQEARQENKYSIPEVAELLLKQRKVLDRTADNNYIDTILNMPAHQSDVVNILTLEELLTLIYKNETKFLAKKDNTDYHELFKSIEKIKLWNNQLLRSFREGVEMLGHLAHIKCSIWLTGCVI